jgi:gamma-butyrobetaine dioxygenase
VSGKALDWIFTAQDHQLTIRWDDGVGGSYTALWLRDNCPEDRDADTGQRLIDVADQPEEPWIGEVFREGDTAISIVWGDEEKTSVFEVIWLREYAGGKPNPVSPRQQPLLWEAAQADDEISASEAALTRWLRALAGYGIAFLRGVPSEPGKVLEVARLIGGVRATNQGLSFDIRSAPAPNSANHTPLALPLHTGAPFHDPIPGVQWLHCLQSGAGSGDNLFLDGYAVAACLREHFPDAYNILTWTPVRFTFRQ